MRTKAVVYSTDKGRHCPVCSKPVDQCRCKQAKQGNSMQAKPPPDGIVRLIKQVKGRAGKPVTIITGLCLEPGELKILAREIKIKCGVGGSIENDNILIQGDKREMIRATLELTGYHVKISGG